MTDNILAVNLTTNLYRATLDGLKVLHPKRIEETENGVMIYVDMEYHAQIDNTFISECGDILYLNKLDAKLKLIELANKHIAAYIIKKEHLEKIINDL